jgi:hypothetical protein
MSDQNKQYTPRPKNALDDYKLRLVGDKLNGASKRAMLAVSIVGNNPRVNVFTNVDNDKDNGIIRAAMDTPTFYLLLDRLEHAINADPGFRDYIENKKPPRDRTQRGLELESKTIVGKDKDGQVYISVISADESRPRAKFVFKTSYHHDLINGSTGQRYSDAELSVMVAKAFHRMMSNLVTNVINTHYKEPEKRPYNGGAGGGGGGWKGNKGGGNYQQNRGDNNAGAKKPPQDFSGDGNWEDDFPM